MNSLPNHKATIRAVLFDVGNTLVFPDRSVTFRPLHERGVFPTTSQIRRAEGVARKAIDKQLLGQVDVSVDRGYWDIYYDTLLRELGLEDVRLKVELATLAGQSGNWSILAEDALDVLSSLRSNYVLGIVSNSDARLKTLLARLGIDTFFDCVIASSAVGYEKPQKGIFEAALTSLAMAPEAAIYAGDIYSVDYMGASAAGIRAVLVDPYEVYSDTEAPRVRSLQELQTFIETENKA